MTNLVKKDNKGSGSGKKYKPTLFDRNIDWSVTVDLEHCHDFPAEIILTTHF